MPESKKGRKGRKIGTGKLKVSHSRFGTYAGVIAHSEMRKRNRITARSIRLLRLAEKRVCIQCGRKGFRDSRALRRHRNNCGRADAA